MTAYICLMISHEWTVLTSLSQLFYIMLMIGGIPVLNGSCVVFSFLVSARIYFIKGIVMRITLFIHICDKFWVILCHFYWVIVWCCMRLFMGDDSSKLQVFWILLSWELLLFCSIFLYDGIFKVIDLELSSMLFAKSPSKLYRYNIITSSTPTFYNFP